MHVMLNSFNFSNINWWSEIPTSITPFWKTFSEELVRMWSSSKDVEHVIRVGSLIISVNENIWQNSLLLFTKAELELLSLYDWFSLRINFPFWIKLILKSPRKYILLVLLSIWWNPFQNRLKNSFSFVDL